MNSPENGSPVVPPSLIEQMAAARQKQQEERAQELNPSRERTDPAFDVTKRPTAAKPPGCGNIQPTGRPMGVLGSGVPNAGQGRDRAGNPVREPNVSDLRDTLPRGDEQ